MVGPDYVRPAVEQPEAYKSAGSPSASPPVAREWWKLYGDAELGRLVDAAHASNQTLRQAAGRVAEARAYARIAASYLRRPPPSTRYFRVPGIRRNRDSTITGQSVGTPISVSDWLVPLDLSYEVDVWGTDPPVARIGLRAGDRERLRPRPRQAHCRGGRGTLLLQPALARRAGRILAETVKAYRDQVRLVTAQVQTGIASPIVLYQARALLEAALAQERDVTRARADQEHALAILCGRAAQSFAVAGRPLEEGAPPAVPPGLPAQLLMRRPDVAEAEQNLIAANAQIGVALADFYPRFTITGQAGVESAGYSNLINWQSRMASIAPGFSLPVFTGGRTRANVEAARARYSQALAAYTNQVLIAYGDVEDSLTDLAAFADETSRLRGAVAASAEYVRVAGVQYRQGLVDYLTVTDALRTLLANRLLLAGAVYLQKAASIRLFKALGGGWENTGQGEKGEGM